jgi:general secretion pathway protein G
MRTTRKNTGFTIVELLIVIVIIGILAAIVIVAYNGITGKANDSAVQSDLANMAKKFGIAKALNGTYPFPPTTSMDIHVTKSVYAANTNNMYYCYDSATDRYAVQAKSVTGQVYKIIDGVVSSGAGPYGYAGEWTCDILNESITWGGSTGSLGYNKDTVPPSWAGWLQ